MAWTFGIGKMESSNTAPDIPSLFKIAAPILHRIIEWRQRLVQPKVLTLEKQLALPLYTLGNEGGYDLYTPQ